MAVFGCDESPPPSNSSLGFLAIYVCGGGRKNNQNLSLAQNILPENVSKLG